MELEGPFGIGVLVLAYFVSPLGIGYWARLIGRSALGWGLATIVLSLVVNTFVAFRGATLMPHGISDLGLAVLVFIQVAISPAILALVLFTKGPTPEAAYAALESRRNKDRQKTARQVAAREAARRENAVEDDAYARALEELSSGGVDKPTMARAIAEAMGDEGKERALYLRARVKQLTDLQARLDEVSARFEDEEARYPDDIIDASGKKTCEPTDYRRG